MATSAATVAAFLEALGSGRIQAKAMFGEYALYADGKVVALACDDRLFVKVHPATAALEGCELAPPYPGAKPHHLVEEGRIGRELASILLRLAAALPEPKPKRPGGAKPKKAAAQRKPAKS